jgi:hypothetical protein
LVPSSTTSSTSKPAAPNHKRTYRRPPGPLVSRSVIESRDSWRPLLQWWALTAHTSQVGRGGPAVSPLRGPSRPTWDVWAVRAHH